MNQSVLYNPELIQESIFYHTEDFFADLSMGPFPCAGRGRIRRRLLSGKRAVHTIDQRAERPSLVL
jgi:hypothetical protein